MDDSSQSPDTSEPPDELGGFVDNEEDILLDTIPTYAESQEAFWKAFDLPYKLKDLVSKIQFWNVTKSNWDIIYDTESGGEFEMGVYPYEGKSVLLCHTLSQGLASYGTMFRIEPAKQYRLGKGGQK